MGSRETIEGGAMASYLTGSMNTFPNKLINLENRPEKIEELEHHLVNLKECFFKVAGRGKADDQAQEWMKQVRELFFDIEDWIDEKLETPTRKKVQQPRTNMVGPSEVEEEIKEINMAAPSEREEEIKETNRVDQSEIEEKIKEFITLTKEACGRSTRYKLDEPATSSGAAVAREAARVIASDSRVILEERPYLRALDHPVDVLKAHLTEDNQKELKVVSIVGTGGLGKTTLAKKIHEDLQGKFQCSVFVHVGHRNASIRTILTNILLQIRPNRCWNYFKEEHEVIAKLWEILSEKRYFVVLDCIRSVRTWRIISCALPDNNLGSRILVTTRMKDVAKSCSPRYSDVVHQMYGLSHDDSKSLFDEKSKTQVDDDVLNMCGGIPLAITMAAGLLTGKYTQLKVQKVLGQHFISSLEQHYSLSPEMTKILHMSYADLSISLRSCFLFLTVFPGHCTISKDHLINIWVAEGFIPRVDDESLWVTGETYFNELICRRLLRPVFDYENDQAVGCTLEPVILDFITALSREENFATTAAELRPAQFLCETIRRFSLNCSSKDEAATFESSTEKLSSIRSLTVFGDVEEMPWAGTKEMPRPQAETKVMPRAETKEMPRAKTKRYHWAKLKKFPWAKTVVVPPVENKRPSVITKMFLCAKFKEMTLAETQEMETAEMPWAETEEWPSPQNSPPEFGLRHWAKNKKVHVSEGTCFLLPFKLLRVLDLGEAMNLEGVHLKGIRGLILLRYLRLAPDIDKLPEEIGELEQLQTIDLRRAYSVDFADFIVNKLQKLVHILFPVSTSKNLYIEHLLGMPELEEVSSIDVRITSSSAAELRKLLSDSKRLRILGVTLRDLVKTETQFLMSFLEELTKSKLDSLSIYCQVDKVDSLRILMDSWKKATASPAAKFEPRRFELNMNANRTISHGIFPPHIDSLGSLTHLHIATERLEERGLRVLGYMKRLVLLNWSSDKLSSAGRCLVKEGAFPSLLLLSLRCYHGGMGLQFEQGGMPQLQTLVLSFTVSRSWGYGNFNFGMENLTCLTRIRAIINCLSATVSEIESAETQAREKVLGHDNKPILELHRLNFSGPRLSRA